VVARHHAPEGRIDSVVERRRNLGCLLVDHLHKDGASRIWEGEQGDSDDGRDEALWQHACGDRKPVKRGHPATVDRRPAEGLQLVRVSHPYLQRLADIAIEQVHVGGQRERG
jgi:hypothetical protein